MRTLRRNSAIMMTNRGFTLVVAASVALSGQVAAAAVTVEAGSTAGTAGQMVEVAITLTADTPEPVAGVENDLTFDPSAPVAIGADGRPDCSPNPAIRKSATAFGFRPIGCNPQTGQCTGAHALVVAVDNIDSIPPGAVLYRCRVALSSEAHGRYPIAITNALYAPPSGGDRTAQGSDGVVTTLQQPANASGGGCQGGPSGSCLPLWLALCLIAGRRWHCSRSLP